MQLTIDFDFECVGRVSALTTVVIARVLSHLGQAARFFHSWRSRILEALLYPSSDRIGRRLRLGAQEHGGHLALGEEQHVQRETLESSRKRHVCHSIYNPLDGGGLRFLMSF